MCCVCRPWGEVIELFPPGFSGQFHFQNMAQWRGDLHYTPVAIQTTVNPESVWSAIRHAVQRVLSTRHSAKTAADASTSTTSASPAN